MAVTEMHNLLCVGAVCNCILPESLKNNAARHDPDCQAEDSEKRRLTGSFGCFSSISLCQRHFSASSLFLRSPTKATWDTKHPKSTRLKKSWQLMYPVHHIKLMKCKDHFFISNLFYNSHQRKTKRALIRCFPYLGVGSSCAWTVVQKMCRNYPDIWVCNTVRWGETNSQNISMMGAASELVFRLW